MAAYCPTLVKLILMECDHQKTFGGLPIFQKFPAAAHTGNHDKVRTRYPYRLLLRFSTMVKPLTHPGFLFNPMVYSDNIQRHPNHH